MGNLCREETRGVLIVYMCAACARQGGAGQRDARHCRPECSSVDGGWTGGRQSSWVGGITRNPCLLLVLLDVGWTGGVTSGGNTSRVYVAWGR